MVTVTMQIILTPNMLNISYIHNFSNIQVIEEIIPNFVQGFLLNRCKGFIISVI